MLQCADKTANLKSMQDDFELVGDKLWDRFNAKKEQINWYYNNMNDAFMPLNEHSLYWLNTNLYQKVFVTHYINSQKNMLYQSNGEESYAFSKETAEWLPYNDDFESLKKIPVETAWEIEDRWAKERV